MVGLGKRGQANVKRKRGKDKGEADFKWHHMIPKSRFRARVSRVKEVAYHALFKNRLAVEAIAILTEWLRMWGKTTFDDEILGVQREYFRVAWQELFGDKRSLPELRKILLSPPWHPPGVYIKINPAKMHEAAKGVEKFVMLEPLELTFIGPSA